MQCKNCIVWAKSDSLARDIIRRAADITVSRNGLFHVRIGYRSFFLIPCDCTPVIRQVGYIVMVDPSTGMRNNLLRMKGASVVGVYHPLIDEKLVRVVRG